MVILADQAKTDLSQIYSFLELNSPFYAEDYVSRLLDTIDTIGIFPEKGRIVPELADQSVREIIAYPYRIIYEIHVEASIVLGIIHAKRDLGSAFEDR